MLAFSLSSCSTARVQSCFLFPASVEIYQVGFAWGSPARSQVSLAQLSVRKPVAGWLSFDLPLGTGDLHLRVRE
jgi:hypothetical protein